ncbi:MAG TPA: 2-amino-4-hydroxy-6-hydroxymethyldihydropteridine diphosphokinase [Myxococcota bacterium]|nr:2-amino-4-hydroxy-6-hydroxymethyldihydropteridine diphosphokinase [Myxococcota bacterium]
MGLGANLGDPAGQLRAALRELSAWGPLRASSLWRSEPLGDPRDPWYVNAVAELRIDGEPLACLHRLRALERAAGRPDVRPKNAPRTLDLDLLLFGDCVIATADLSLPHPGLARRRFVLAPLAELAPALVPPGQTRPIAQLLRDLDDPLRVEKLCPGTEAAP